MKSREKRLITKEHIVTHTHLKFVFTLQHISNKASKQRYKIILSHDY